jgi:hypothetical protein
LQSQVLQKDAGTCRILAVLIAKWPAIFAV